MKISKLFHWLYAFLMMLPVFAVMVCCVYVVSNKNAKDSYYGETINETQSIVVNEVNEFTPNREYNFANLTITEVPGFTINTTNSSFFCDYVEIGTTRYENVRFSLYCNSYETNAYFFLRDLDTDTFIIENGSLTTNIFKLYLNTTNITQEVYNLFSSKFYALEYNRDSFLSEVFYYSLNEVFEMPVFGWAKNSFLALPITYITGLFGMASTNVVNYYLSYWLAISIVYLVFDLIMYVPLLVHRWIDKGIVE